MLEHRTQMKKLLVILIVISLLTSCGPTVNKADLEKESTFSLPYNSTVFGDSIIELTTAQQLAFDALDELQMSGDGSNRLYSTFTNHYQPFYPPDTSVVISRSEFQTAMSSFLKKHYGNLSLEERERFAETTALAQEEYKVFHCSVNSSSLNYKIELPRSGVWVMPNVLGHRDVVLEWE